MQNYYSPIVIENNGNGERQYDIYSRLLMDRIIFLGTAIDDYVANVIQAQLLFLVDNFHRETTTQSKLDEFHGELVFIVCLGALSFLFEQRTKDAEIFLIVHVIE